MKEDNAYKIGYDAGLDSPHIDIANPYPEDSLESKRWNTGYQDACFDIRVWNGSE